MRIRAWSLDLCSSDLRVLHPPCWQQPDGLLVYPSGEQLPRQRCDEEDPLEIRQQLFPYAVAFQLFRLRRQSDIAVTGQHDLLLDEHHFDDEIGRAPVSESVF